MRLPDRHILHILNTCLLRRLGKVPIDECFLLSLVREVEVLNVLKVSREAGLPRIIEMRLELSVIVVANILVLRDRLVALSLDIHFLVVIRECLI